MKLDIQQNTVAASFGATKRFELNHSPQLFKILSDSLYSDKIGSIVREISSNCLDSHIEAGKADIPFEITLPKDVGYISNTANNMLVFRDFGNGLSHEEMQSIYTTYCMSTKNNSNDLIGAFGIGSKSPFSYTDSFYVTSIHNGKKTRYNAHIDSQGFPTLATISEENTNEPSGLTVSIPIKKEDFDKVNNAIKKQLKMFSVLPIIKDEPDFFKKEDIDIIYETDDFKYYNKSSSLDNICVINVSGICYNVNSDQLSKLKIPGPRNFFELKAQIGSVDLTASRENIAYTKKTEEYIINACKNMYTYILNDYLKICKENKWNYISKLDNIIEPMYKLNETLEKIIKFVDYPKYDAKKLLKTSFSLKDNIKNLNSIILYTIYRDKLESDNNHILKPYQYKKIYYFTKKYRKADLVSNINDIRTSYIIYPLTPLRKKEDIDSYKKIINDISTFINFEIQNGDELIDNINVKVKNSTNHSYRYIHCRDLISAKIHVTPYNFIRVNGELEHNENNVYVYSTNNNNFLINGYQKNISESFLKLMIDEGLLSNDSKLIIINKTMYNKLKKTNPDIDTYMLDYKIDELEKKFRAKNRIDVSLFRNINPSRFSDVLRVYSIDELKELSSNNKNFKPFLILKRLSEFVSKYSSLMYLFGIEFNKNRKNDKLTSYLNKKYPIFEYMSLKYYNVPEAVKNDITKYIGGK